MSRLAPGAAVLPQVYSRQEIADRLVYWREHLLEHRAGESRLTYEEIVAQLNRWLDERLELRGR